MKTHKWSEIRAKKFTPKQRAKLDREVKAELLETDLSEFRKLAGKTQADVAAKAKMSQGELSKAERREDHLLSTLRRYVAALGGELEVIARIGDKTVRLRGV